MSTTTARSGTGRRDKTTPKRGRFNARLTEVRKRLFERAAAIYGQSVSRLVMSSAQRGAERAIRQHEVITLSAEDSRAVMEALPHPEPPNDAIRRAAERYTELLGEQ